ncbi:MAG: DJ-1/PfpI family protein [Oscillospiraceae bacterium]|nr:DJ-1/PfpI family protein [Oscillospiraceae bacterium]
MVYVFLAEGFEEIEALTPVDYLRRAGKDVTLLGVTGKHVTGAHAITVTADTVITDDFLLPEDAELIFLPGGMPGTKNLAASVGVKHAIRAALDRNIFIAAICAAPMVLCQNGCLQGGQAVIFPGMEAELCGATASQQPIVVWNKTITARSAGVAGSFAIKLIEMLCGAEHAKKIKESIYPNW